MWVGSEEQSCPCGTLNHLYGGIYSWFSLAVHFDLSGSESIFSISQDLPLCVHASLNQDGFYRRGLWVVVSVDITPLLTSKKPFCLCAVGEVSWLSEWKVYGLLSLTLAGPSFHPCLSNHSCLGILVHRWKISNCFTLWDQLRRAWQPTPIFLPGESHGQRSLEGYIFHRAAKSRTWIRQHSTHTYTHTHTCVHARTHTHTHTHRRPIYLLPHLKYFFPMKTNVFFTWKQQRRYKLYDHYILKCVYSQQITSQKSYLCFSGISKWTKFRIKLQSHIILLHVFSF